MTQRPTQRSFTRFVDAIQYLIGVAAATTVVLLFSLGDDATSSSSSALDPEPAAAQASDELTVGEAVYADECAICHGPSGAGGTGPALDGQMIEKYPDPKTQELVVAFGRNAMTGFTDRLTAEQISAVVAYTREALGVDDHPATTTP